MFRKIYTMNGVRFQKTSGSRIDSPQEGGCIDCEINPKITKDSQAKAYNELSTLFAKLK